MNVAVIQDQLKYALSIAAKVVEPRPAIPVLSHLLLRAADGRFEITGSNLEQVVTVSVNARVDAPGEITLPARAFAELVSNLPPERIDMALDADTSTMAIRCGTTKSKLKGLPADEFPPTPAQQVAQIVMPADELKRLILGVAVCAAKDDARPILTGIYMSLENGCLVVAAADGYRLAVMRSEVRSDQSFTQIVPADSLKMFASVLGDDDSPVSIAFDNNRVYLTHKQVSVAFQMLEGKFPDFESLLPRHWNTRATLYTEDLLRACKRAEIFARDSDYSTRFTFTPSDTPNAPGEINVIGRSAERGDLEAQLDATVEGEALTAAYNVKFLMDILSVLPSERVIFDTDGEKHPATFSPASDNGNHTYLLMPMSINR